MQTARRKLIGSFSAAAMLLLMPAASSAQTACTVTFRLQSAVTPASLQFDVAYDRADLEITGTSNSVSCANVAPALGTFTDDDSGATGVLNVAYVAPSGFSGPRDLLICDFTTDNEPFLSDFAVTVVDATDTSYATLTPLPTVVPSSVDCGGVFNTTTTTSTSTTTSTLPADPTACTLEFSLADAVTLGSLQWEVDYTNAPGEFGGSGSGVQCQNKVTTAFGSMQDNEAQRRVITALISLAGFSGPRLLSQCTFVADVRPEVTDFVITVNDAADQNIQPLNPRPAIVLSGITCAGDTTTNDVVDDHHDASDLRQWPPRPRRGVRRRAQQRRPRRLPARLPG